MTIEKITVSDRNALAFFLVNGQPCQFVNNAGRLEGVFDNTQDFQRIQTEYLNNGQVRIQSFVAASKLISSMILKNRNQEVQP